MASYMNIKQERKSKTKVEQCGVLELKYLRLLDLIKFPGTVKEIKWNDRNRGIINRAQVSMHFDWQQEDFYTYIAMDIFNFKPANIDIKVKMSHIPGNLGGTRWYFQCPLRHDGVECGRRTHKLYLPEGGLFFGCRQCHDLTYQTTCEGPVNRRFRKHCKEYERENDFKQIRKRSFLNKDRQRPTYRHVFSDAGSLYGPDSGELNDYFKQFSNYELKAMFLQLKSVFEPENKPK